MPQSRVAERARPLSLAALAIALLFGAPATLIGQQPSGRALTTGDVAAWKSIRSGVLSNDGAWFAYQLAPNEGDGQVVVRATKGTAEYRFPAGEMTLALPLLGPTGPTSAVVFSADSKWLAFVIAPDAKDAKKLRKDHKPLHNSVALVDLASGKMTSFPKTRRFAFAGERGGWIALLGYAPESAASPAAGSAPATPPAPAVTGADLVLRQLATGLETNIGNVGDFAFDKPGHWLAWTVEARDQSGNGVQLRNMLTDAVRPLDSDRAWYRRLAFSEKGDALAVLKGSADSVYTDTLYSVVTFTSLSAAASKRVMLASAAKGFPDGQTVSPDRTPAWATDASGVYIGTHALRHIKKPSPGSVDDEKPDVVIWNWKDPRLQSQQEVEEGRDKTYSFAAFFRVSDGAFVRLADDELRDVTTMADASRFVTGSDVRGYELAGNLDGHRYHDIYAVDLSSGQRRLIAKKAVQGGGGFGVAASMQSPDGSKLLVYDAGDYFAYDLATGAKTNLTKSVATHFWDMEDDHNVVKPPIAPVGWTKTGDAVLLSDAWDIWLVPARAGAAAINLTGNGRKDGIRYTRLRLDRDERSIDMTKPQYFQAYGERTKKEGIARVAAGKAGAQMLTWNDSKIGLLKARDADVFVYAQSTSTTFPDYYATDATLAPGRRLTDANPQQKEFAWSSGAKLIDYVSDKGDSLQAALYLPANYQPGKSYPTVVYIYEKLSQNLHAYKAPSNTEALNVALYTSRGYAVLQPDIHYRVNDPGMSAVWCVIPALQAAIGTGVVDSARVALQGHSWGGYQTAFLVTQSKMFKAAIAGAPLTDMVSMYLSIYWNSGGGDMAIFEASQGRFAGAWWDNWDAYYRNSPIFAAKNVTTPLVILHNDKDGAVDRNQGIEYFSTLRRMGKPVVMLEYKGENHGLAKPVNQKDYAMRMREFFDHFLIGTPAPSWWTDGVPHLKLDEYLRAQQRVATDEDKKSQTP